MSSLGKNKTISCFYRLGNSAKIQGFPYFPIPINATVNFRENTKAETFSFEPYHAFQALETRLESAGQDNLESVLQSRLGRGPRGSV